MRVIVIDKDEISENIPKLESAEVVLMHCNGVKNDYQQASKMLFSFVANKQFGQLINISSYSLKMLNAMNRNFLFIDVLSTDQNSRPVEIEDNMHFVIG